MTRPTTLTVREAREALRGTGHAVMGVRYVPGGEYRSLRLNKAAILDALNDFHDEDDSLFHVEQDTGLVVLAFAEGSTE